MGRDTSIEWARHTFNPWWGCVKLSPACDNCYAEAWDKRTGGDHWGPHAEYRLFGDKHWNEPLRWNKAALAAGERHRVFSASMADIFDNRAPEAERYRLWELIRATPALDWLLLTKRPQNIAQMLPANWGEGYPNVWLGTTVENEAEAARRIDHLLKVPAALHFLSCEPLLGFVNLETLPRTVAGIPGVMNVLTGTWRRSSSFLTPPSSHRVVGLPEIDWVICGGESGPGARPMDPDWARSLRAQCQRAGVPFLFKQWGDWHADALRFTEVGTGACPPANMRVGKKAAGRLLDGVTWDQVPQLGER
ncbi:MAG: phage Gp37/Gp68 family protein [Azospirillaceae bacterium]|nr:phage Gp37/Gp68 family protein [Azospirillaceae bacterium]